MFAWMLAGPGWSQIERKRSLAILVLFIGSCVFWAVYEQAGSSLSLFAQRNTRDVAFGFHFPPSWFQSLPAIFIIVLAPVFAWVWIALGKHEPSSPLKFSLALVFVGFGMVILVPAAMSAGAHGKVSPLWLTVTYLLHTIGELMLSPVGLSAMTKLAPYRALSLIMGLWFLSMSIGDYLSGRAAALYTSLPVSTLFGIAAGCTLTAAIIGFVLVKPTERLMSGVK
jgi:POT family proton-dependent oligopeptide transporter